MGLVPILPWAPEVPSWEGAREKVQGKEEKGKGKSMREERRGHEKAAKGGSSPWRLLGRGASTRINNEALINPKDR